ncbi:MAG: hypothetical protein ABIK33_00120 [candidate division WOR-3 bacterium]
MNNWTKATLIISLLFVTLLNAEVVKFTRKISFGVQINTIYDNNIYLYSPDYIADFREQIRAYRFPINTYDDFITNINLSLRIPHAKSSNIYLYYKQYLYAMNAEKSYQIVSMTISQNIANNLKSKIGYLFLPQYLIRYYRDPLGSATRYIACAFAEHLFTFGFEYNLSNIKLNPFVRYEIDNYKKNFNFYDGEAFRFGLSLMVPIKFINLTAQAERKLNNAMGPVPDISYNQNAYQLTLTSPFYQKKLSFNISGSFQTRIYTTENAFEIDPYHKDRNDKIFSFGTGLNYRLSKKIQMSLEYEKEKRSVNTPYNINIEEIKDYQAERISLGIRLNPNFVIQQGE